MNKANPRGNTLTFLIAEDDPDDRMLIEQAFNESGLSPVLHFVDDGIKLIEYLFSMVKHAETVASPELVCILLDLNMPRKNGLEALREIRQKPEFEDLPVIVLTTSDSEYDRKYCSELGVSNYFTKPGSFADLLDIIRKIGTLCLS